MNVGFTGTQYIDKITTGQMIKLIDQIKKFAPEVEEWHHGGCKGADNIFHLYACFYMRENNNDGKIFVHPASNVDPIKVADIKPQKDIIVLDPVPALDRNQDIVDNVDILIALPSSSTEVKRSGTWATIRRARKKGIDIIFIHKIKIENSTINK